MNLIVVFILEDRDNLHCVKSYGLLSIPCFREEHGRMCDNNKSLQQNEIKPVHRQASDFGQQPDTVTIILCSEHSLDCRQY